MSAIRTIRQLLRSAMAATLPRGRFMVSGPRRSNAVSLTFDDGPHLEHTPPILDTLRDAGVVATFFVVGQRAEQHPNLIRRIVAEGHTLAHHSYTHSVPALTPAKQFLAEVRQTHKLLHEITGQSVRLFRPPHGKLTLSKLTGLWRESQTVVLWNVDPKDFERSSAEISSWFVDHPIRGGDIILLHDDRPSTAAALAGVIAHVRQQGLTFTTPEAWSGTLCETRK